MSDTESDHYVYVLRCADDTLYTGYTTDPARRVAEHDADEGAKYTRGRTPVELVHVERFDTKSGAMSREYAVKQLSRSQKDRLVAADGDRTGRGDERTGESGRDGERSAAGERLPPRAVLD